VTTRQFGTKVSKDTANRLSRGEIRAPTVLSVQSAFKIAGDISRKSWQRLWDNEHTGRYTYNLILVVNTKVLFPLDGDIGISYCRLLLHSSMLKDDCYRFGISATPVCVRGADRETSEHFLLHCNIHKKTRIELFEQIHQITASKDIHQTVTTSEEMLLAPVSELISKNKTDSSKIFYLNLFPAPNEHCNQNSTVFTSSHLHHVDCSSVLLLIIQEIQLRQYILQL